MKTITEKLNATIIHNEKSRTYIGASSIGNDCVRALWYAYNGYERLPMDPRRRRTMQIGKDLELLLLNEMIDAGMQLEYRIDYNSFKDASIPQFQGNVDGLWLNSPTDGKAILEIKTAKDSSFRIFQRSGLRRWYPVYFAQVQSYMGMSGIHTAYVLALNKDTSELHDEQVTFQPFFYERLVEKAKGIVEMVEVPNRVNDSPLFFQCKLCDFRNICHDKENE